MDVSRTEVIVMPRRIAIVGGSGAGKTTLGKRLASLIGGSFVEVDAIQHKAQWTKASEEAIRTCDPWGTRGEDHMGHRWNV